jgi:hypothetical protein
MLSLGVDKILKPFLNTTDINTGIVVKDRGELIYTIHPTSKEIYFFNLDIKIYRLYSNVNFYIAIASIEEDDSLKLFNICYSILFSGII